MAMVLQSKDSINIGIVGLGLIGGSLSLDLQKLGYRIYGLTHRKESVKKAKQRSLGTVISTDPLILKDCSIVILALPIKQLLNPSNQLINAIPQDAVVTDVGSVKSPILKIWRQLHPRFIASHPMAGTNKSGVDAGQENLFQGKPWIATPELGTDPVALEIIHQLALSLGSTWITTNAELHDQSVALISHLPVFISACLLKAMRQTNDSSIFELAKDIASSGFFDTTRVGGGNEELGVAMATTNKVNLLKALSNYKQSIEELEEYIVSENWAQLEVELRMTKEIRSNIINKLSNNS